ncbi:MAG: hydroxylamine reductase [Spirochaetota bacterium]
MFCYQCEQTAGGKGCTKRGVCGKDADTSNMQDLLVHVVKGLSMYALRARQMGESDPEIDAFVPEALFVTLTNTDFDAERIGSQYVRTAARIKNKAKALYQQACADAGREPEQLSEPATFIPAGDFNGMLAQGRDISIAAKIEAHGQDVAGLQELILYGLKGAGAYTHHAHLLGMENEEVCAGFHQTMDYLAGNPLDVNELTAKAMETGELNLKVMRLLDSANTGAYGHPEPTRVRITPVKGKCIVVSGHDLKDLAMLLEQTRGTGIDIYTHGEMLPCNAYPELKKYDHLKGNYGGAWQNQQKEFEEFHGAILMTTNCLMKPRSSYKDRIFTTGVVGWSGVKHIEAAPDGAKDFSPVIQAAQNAEGFSEDAAEQDITIGFAHNAVMSVMDKVVEAVKTGRIRRFFIIGGCDGAKPGRNYYTRLAKDVPDDCIILTMACGKYRFNNLPFGDIDGIPRLLDCGQCNDSYSAIQIALAFSKAFNTEVTDLPLSFILSWYEQKAVAILLTLLHLGVRNIKVGPLLPAFVGPNVWSVLQDKYNIAAISNVDADLEEALSMVG